MQQAKTGTNKAKATSPRSIEKSSFRELFSNWDIGYYGAAIIVYFLLGIAFKDKVLNIGIGPLFFIVWIWVAPPAFEWIRKRIGNR